MKLALLSSDDEALALVRAALDSGRHELVWAGEFADRPLAFEQVGEARAVEGDDWELLAGGAADAVVVATSDNVERRADQLRQLVQAGVAVCVSNCGALGPIVCYELDMNRAETEAPLVPFLAERRHPAIDRIAAWTAASTTGGQPPSQQTPSQQPPSQQTPTPHPPIGAIRQIAMDRGMRDTRAAGVLRALARDVDVVRALLGDVTRISAAGVPTGEASPERDFAGLNVYLTTASGSTTVRWAVDRQLPPGDGRITLDGDAGRAVLTMTGECWTLRVEPQSADSSADTPPPPSEESFALWRPAEVVLANLEAAAEGRKSSPDWLDAARAADAADMVEVSLRRGRTIDLYNETYSEQGTFKGVMGIAGCALVLLALLTLIGAAIGQKTARFLGMEWLAVVFGHWHYGLLGVLLTFLLLQLLRFVVPADGKRRARDTQHDAANVLSDQDEETARPHT